MRDDGPAAFLLLAASGFVAGAAPNRRLLTDNCRIPDNTSATRSMSALACSHLSMLVDRVKLQMLNDAEGIAVGIFQNDEISSGPVPSWITVRSQCYQSIHFFGSNRRIKVVALRTNGRAMSLP